MTQPIADSAGGVPSPAPWAGELAARLFTAPAQWGWRAADYPLPRVPEGIDLHRPPEWVRPPQPDISHLRRIQSAAFQGLLVSIAVTVAAALLLLYGYGKIRLHYDREVVRYCLIGAAIIMALRISSTLGKLGRVYIADRNVRNYLRPYRQAVELDRERHQRLAAQWQDMVRQYERSRAEAQYRQEHDAAWYPVRPAVEPARIDVIGGDFQRHGWASLLLTLGVSVLAAGQRITLLDLTGQQVGNGLLDVARARGLAVRRVDLPAEAGGIALLDGLGPHEISEYLANALTERREGDDLRHERALNREVIQRVTGCLDAPVSFARLAAGIQVLRQATPPAGVLASGEVSRLAEHVGEIGQDEMATRQLRLMVSQLMLLADIAPATGAGRPLFSADPMTVITTPGGRNDRKDLLDRVVVQLAQQALPALGAPAGFLIIAGADQIGAAALEALSGHARQAGIRLLLMIAQPQGDIENTVGTGGAVCFMKMHNHRDAAIAAEFIGRGHAFVVSQITRQTGASFTDGAGDSFAAESEVGSESGVGQVRERGQANQLTESRAHTWTGVRNYSMTQNLSHSTATSRVYEFRVDPAQLLDMPPTAFILVDSTGSARQIVLADSNPGICLLDRVALIPARMS